MSILLLLSMRPPMWPPSHLLEVTEGIEGDRVAELHIFDDAHRVDPDGHCAPGDTARAPSTYRIELWIHFSDALDSGAVMGVQRLLVQPRVLRAPLDL